MLLRADLHKLFDDGYLTITTDHRVEVSPLLREEFHNGLIYYDLHGERLSTLPARLDERPSKEYLLWYNEHVYKAG